MRITQLASFRPRQLKHFSNRQINALPAALSGRLNKKQKIALINASSSRRISEKAKRRISDPSEMIVVDSNQFVCWLDAGSVASWRQADEKELMDLFNPFRSASSDLPLDV